MSHDCLSRLTEKGDFCISKFLEIFGKVTFFFFFQKSSVWHFPTLILSMALCPKDRMPKRRWIWLSRGDSATISHHCQVLCLREPWHVEKQVQGPRTWCEPNTQGSRPIMLHTCHKGRTFPNLKPTHYFTQREKKSADMTK